MESYSFELTAVQLAVLTLAGGLLVGFAAGISVDSMLSKTADSPSENDTTGEQDLDPTAITSENRPSQGSDDADVNIYYFSDYQCPFCNRFEQNTLPQIENKLVDEGEVKVIRKSYAFMGQDSLTAEIASKCAWRGAESSDAYWNWNKEVFNNQGDKDGGWASKSSLIGYTENVEGVSAENVSSCMEENREELVNEVRTDMSEGQEFGITGTPGFVISNPETGDYETLSGAQPYVRFANAVNSVK